MFLDFQHVGEIGGDIHHTCRYAVEVLWLLLFVRFH